MTKYSIEGRFPGSDRILVIGPRRKTFTSFTTNNNGGTWSGALAVKEKEINGDIVFRRKASGQPFETEKELINYLVDNYSVTYLRDLSQPAVSTGG